MPRRGSCALTAVAVAVSVPAVAVAADAGSVRSLDGSANNVSHPDWGRAGTPYPRVAAPDYADGRAAPVSGPGPRYVSNRIFNDTAQNLFSENGVTQWGAVWGQFLDHTFGLRQETGGEHSPLAFAPRIRSSSSATTSARSPSSARPPRPEPGPPRRVSS